MAANSPKPLPHWGVCSLSPLQSKPPPSNNHTLLLPQPGRLLPLPSSGGLQLPSACEWPASPTSKEPQDSPVFKTYTKPSRPRFQVSQALFIAKRWGS